MQYLLIDLIHNKDPLRTIFAGQKYASDLLPFFFKILFMRPTLNKTDTVKYVLFLEEMFKKWREWHITILSRFLHSEWSQGPIITLCLPVLLQNAAFSRKWLVYHDIRVCELVLRDTTQYFIFSFMLTIKNSTFLFKLSFLIKLCLKL